MDIEGLRIDNSIPLERFSAQSLAYIGDAVYELLVRSHVLTENVKVSDLSKDAIMLSKAVTQSQIYKKIEHELSEEEAYILKKGRNYSPKYKPKSASLSQYRHATGVEALFGYLYLKGETKRIIELFNMCGEI